jgi:hypothetical protein
MRYKKSTIIDDVCYGPTPKNKLWCPPLMPVSIKNQFSKIKKPSEPRSRSVRSRSEPAVVRPRRRCLGGARAWMVGAPTQPLSAPSAQARPAWAHTAPAGSGGVEPKQSGGGVEPGHVAAVESRRSQRNTHNRQPSPAPTASVWRCSVSALSSACHCA